MQIIRRLDYQGRVTLPKPFVNALKLYPEDELAIELNNGVIQITSAKNYCCICNKETDSLFENRPLCDDCIAKIKTH